MKHLRSLYLPLILCVMFLLTGKEAYSKIGVGVGTGKIIIEEKLKPGTIYHLPPITVFNTGDRYSDYFVHLTYHEGQKEIKVPESWIIFRPNEFGLEKEKSQLVEITLNLPIKTEPGDYFAYLEAQPVQKSESGTTTIAVAAATKLYFTVIPASFMQGIYYRIITFWKAYAPWTYAGLGFILFIGLMIGFRKFVKIDISLRGKDKEKKKDKNKGDSPLEENENSESDKAGKSKVSSIK